MLASLEMGQQEFAPVDLLLPQLASLWHTITIGPSTRTYLLMDHPHVNYEMANSYNPRSRSVNDGGGDNLGHLERG